MRPKRTAFALLSLVAFAAAPGAAAPPPWVEVRSPHFTVLTNASERDGREAAWQFEQIRQVLRALWPWATVDGGRPLLVVAARDEATLRSLAPQHWAGGRPGPTSFWVDGVDRLFVGLRTDLPAPRDEGENPNQAAYFSYATAVFSRSLPGPVPEWFTRGLAEIVANSVVREKEVQVGRSSARHLRRLQEQPGIPIEEFLNAKGASPWLTDEEKLKLFDAQAWLFLHCLMFGENGANRERVADFGQRLHDGESVAEASSRSFDRLGAYGTALTAYRARGNYQFARVPTDRNVPAEGFVARRLSIAESALERAHFLAAMERPAEARVLAKEARAEEPTGPATDEIEATLLDFGGDEAGARKAYQRAVERGSRRGQIHLRLAQLELEGEKDRAARERAAARIEKAAQLEPWRAISLSLLSMVKVDLGEVQAAIGLAQKAIDMEPFDPFHRIQLARALSVAGRRDDALAAARTAVRVAKADEDRQSAHDFLEYLNRPGKAPSQAKVGDPRPVPAPDEDRESRKAEAAIEECVADRNDASCTKAVPFLQASCERRVARSCRVLGSLFESGRGVALDQGRAAQAFDAGCRGALDKPSCARYAALQVEGRGVTKDEAGGLATLQGLCAEQVAEACSLLKSLPAARE
jgi:tetratricopeptide (TPR) repeat protein